jgi:hypothetical protein
VVDVTSSVWSATPKRSDGARLITVTSPVLTLEARRVLHRRSGAVAVDMESAVAALCCREAGVPFACLRAVSDDAHASFPPTLLHAIEGEHVHLLRLAWAVVRQPLLLRDLARLARHSRIAAAALAEGLLRLLGTRAT